MEYYTFSWIGFALLFLFICLILLRYRKKNRRSNNRNNISSTGYPPRDHYTVDMSSSAGSNAPRYYGQEYSLSNTTSSNQQLPTYRPNDDLTPPPPSYQDYKKDIRLPNTN